MSDAALILNGGTAQAGSSITPSSLTVGTASNTGTASGSLDVTSGDLTLGSILQVGNTTSAATGTSATGLVNVAGAISGVTGNLLVGSNQGLGSSANGTITADSYSGTHGFLGIGRDDKGGSGTGSLVVTNQLALAGKVNFFEVGHIFGDGLVADGELRAGSGDVLTGFSTIGTHNGSVATAGNVSGVVKLGTGSLSSDQTGALTVGKLSFGRSGTVVGELNTAGLSGFGSQSIGVADGDTSGTVTGTLVVGAGGIAGGSLAIGTTSGAANATGSASSGGGVTLTSSLMVGNNSGGAGSTADGALRITNGDLLIDGSITVGQVSGSDTGKQAIATLALVDGELAAQRVGIGQAAGAGSTNARVTLQGVTGRIQSLQVGESFDAQGNPNGRVELLGSVLNAEEFVALGSGLSGGSGNGAISLKDSRLNVGVGPESGSFYGDMFVGTSGAGSQAGLMLERSLVDVADRLLLGAASQLQIGIEGGLRIAQYGAIDTRTAVLGGDLDLRFDFTPLLDSMVFDLVLSELLDGISGDFANVSILGLDAAYSAVTGVEIVNFGGADVEVYRLRIARNGVPEPATVFLMLITLGAMFASRAIQRERFLKVS
ncbi:PEP-CTERM sorting domain-containing protein [Candidatus Accumulibacter sp. ACC007]|uniref:beta strand repeat-containing protein n=1 Tax=Candidatus Accumulibacter sp. ACC007 TaxID=2823333 RepID=UPI0025BF7AE7|nr:PEP-CTERM sorting domain-containing protein [Candidatus Accumulibacter sp. ACC007]